MKTNSTNQRHSRSAFTLLELIAVIAIISILMALILPALSGVRRNANVVAVQSEMRQLEQALANFEKRFGILPPSSLSVPAMGDPWDVEDRAAIRAIWPQFDFASRGGLDSITPIPPKLELNGAECLVFFLGGLENGTVTPPILAGFSTDPQRPWTQSANAEKFMEFDVGRMVDLDGDSLFEYLDAIPDQAAPILFLSSRGKRYNTKNDLTTNPNDDYDVFPDDSRNLQMCYFEADNKTPLRSGSYQLISPGYDGEYGSGGEFFDGVSLSARINERDNISNFSDGEFE